MTFFSREDAGRRLGQHLRENHAQADLVLGLPRGGVVVAAEIAQVLHLPLGVIVVRKLGHPRHREFAVGALAEGEVVVLDQPAIERTHVNHRELDEIIAEEKARLREYQLKFGRDTSPSLHGKRVLLVDDGLATGATAEAAVLSAQKRGATRVMVAVPVASDSACARLNRMADQVIALLVDPAFDAVGRYYEHFTQTTDEEVIELLKQSEQRQV
jgi:putative phosphoribosyl transferase